MTETPPGCKKIVVLRDPFDVLVSFYKFFENWFFDEGSVTLDDFARDFWLARGLPVSRMNNASYFVHLVSWYHHRDKDDVLIIFFEDLKDDLENQVLRVAKFISTEKVRTRERLLNGMLMSTILTDLGISARLHCRPIYRTSYREIFF